MQFNLVDIIALAILAIGVIRGWRAGLIVMAGNIASLIVGLVASTYIFYWLSATSLFSGVATNHPYLSIIGYLIILGIVTKLLRLLVALINQVWKVIAILPFLGSINRLFGSVIGLAESAVVLVILTYLIQNFLINILSSAMMATISASYSFSYLSSLVSHLQFLIPSINI
jgi:uncharacterized membrane protein required for colicin V production